MGLDMYLYGIMEDKKEDPFEIITGKYEEVAYWRKANQIHKWFSDRYIQKRNPWSLYEIEERDLQGLLSLCIYLKELKDGTVENCIIETKRVNLFKKYFPDCDSADYIAAVLLPPDNIGCFFGTPDVDDWYWESIYNTIDFLKTALTKGYDKYYYQASW